MRRLTLTLTTLCNVSHDNITENTDDMRMLYGIVNHKEAYNKQYNWYDLNSNSDVSAIVIQTNQTHIHNTLFNNIAALSFSPFNYLMQFKVTGGNLKTTFS